jgi:hypothetical protein
VSEPAWEPGDPRVVVYGKPGCHLCEDAEHVVAAVCEETGEHGAPSTSAATRR